jgi:hypothetical protein
MDQHMKPRLTRSTNNFAVLRRPGPQCSGKRRVAEVASGFTNEWSLEFIIGISKLLRCHLATKLQPISS